MERGKNERGQGLVEYALILLLVVIVLVILVTIYGAQAGNLFSQLMSAWPE